MNDNQRKTLIAYLNNPYVIEDDLIYLLEKFKKFNKMVAKSNNKK